LIFYRHIQISCRKKQFNIGFFTQCSQLTKRRFYETSVVYNNRPAHALKLEKASASIPEASPFLVFLVGYVGLDPTT